MSAIVSCKDHDHNRRSIYDMCDTNEGGEVSNYNSITYIQKMRADFIHLVLSSVTRSYGFLLQTALQVYVQSYKSVQNGQIHGLLRKARRLDSIINNRSNPSPYTTASPSPQISSDPQCDLCQTNFSPAFHYEEDDTTILGTQRCLCHKCYWEMKAERNKMTENSQNSTSAMGMIVS